MYNGQGFIRIFFVGDDDLFFYCWETLTMWLIDHSEGGRGGGVSSHAAHSAEAYCLIPILTVIFTLWTNKGSAIVSSTGTARLQPHPPQPYPGSHKGVGGKESLVHCTCSRK